MLYLNELIPGRFKLIVDKDIDQCATHCRMDLSCFFQYVDRHFADVVSFFNTDKIWIRLKLSE